MKPSRDAAALAASLSAAASAPLQRPPERPVPPVPANMSVAPAPPPIERDAAPARQVRKQKAPPDTVGITLRPDRELLNRYTMAAADRTRTEGRVISAQQMMLEVLERHAPGTGR
jgi:hypothetical protein